MSLFCAALALAQPAAPRPSLESVLGELRATGIEIIYSSELVTAGMDAPPSTGNMPPLQRAREALAAHGLALRELGANTFVVVRAPPRELPADVPEPPMEEISVYASRYAIEAGLAEPRSVSPTDLERIPGGHDDALRTLQSLPGVVSGASARPYIRGSLSEDVLVRYDGITLLDPFHLKNFQSLLSAIDPAAIERIEVFSGGFPVRYGTRSGGVIDIAAPSHPSGREYRASLSLISAGASTRGRSESLPLEWLAAIRRSTLDLLDPVEDDLGEPQFSDSLGRLRWSTERGAWTLGWLLLDDRLVLGTDDDDQHAVARYRDEYVWAARDHDFSDALGMRTSLVLTSAERRREGTLNRPGVASGELAEQRGFNGIEFSSDWTYDAGAGSSYSFGGGFVATRAAYRYARHAEYSPEIAAAFARDVIDDVQLAVAPRVGTYALYAANRRKWSRFEAELGVRADAQHYEHDGNHVQFSPRLNLRYDLDDGLRLYASAGRFTQAQHVEEWRVEEAQQAPDAAQVSMHSILGLEFDFANDARFGIEAYSKRWTTVSPYFDNSLEPFALLPDLTPDRIRLRPRVSEASGVELSARHPFTRRLQGWGTFTWSRVADDFGGGADVRRSWDQPVSMSAGLAWKDSRASLSALVGWHSGWPRTPLSLSPLALEARNSGRWQEVYSLDVRGGWTWQMPGAELSLVLDVTNATNRRNPCCAVLVADPGPQLSVERDHWLPVIVNLGVTWRWLR
jgi:outer membrane receptor protein involved in Fe transport